MPYHHIKTCALGLELGAKLRYGNIAKTVSDMAQTISNDHQTTKEDQQ